MSKLVEFIERLHKNTIDGNVKWSESSQEEIYQTSFPNYTLQIFTDKDNHGNIEYVVQILNEEGKVIEDISDADIQNELPRSFEIMQSLYEKARSQAMGLDKALDEIMSYLPTDDNNEPSFDEPPF